MLLLKEDHSGYVFSEVHEARMGWIFFACGLSQCWLSVGTLEMSLTETRLSRQ